MRSAKIEEAEPVAPPNRRQRRANQAHMNRLGFRYACQACGAPLLRVPVAMARKKPKMVSTLLAKASEKHEASTGCDGAPKPPTEAA